MADIEKWLDESPVMIKWGKEFKQSIYVKRAIMYGDQRCEHCLKIIKEGKPVFCPAIDSFQFLYNKSGWGKLNSINGWKNKPTFCSSNHAKLFAKNNNGL